LNVPYKTYERVVSDIGDAQVVLIGEATHGTHEFYEIRAEITRRLIEEKGFTSVAIEGDWPDAYQINRYIHTDDFTSVYEALDSFDRFPTWMWQNVVVAHFAQWLKEHNKKQLQQERINFYGLDLYSLYRSIDAVIVALERVDKKLAQQARAYYSCFEQFRHDPQQYGYSLFLHASRSCQEAAFAALGELEEKELQLFNEQQISEDDVFSLLQNARVVQNAEEYCRSLFINEVSNWNLRDTHMMQTLEAILKQQTRKGIENPKIIVWAHNSHVGDSRATEMGAAHEVTLGKLIKEKFGSKAYSLGFTTYNGTVSAASDWHMPVERKVVRDALPDSYESLFHHVGMAQFFLPLQDKAVVPSHMLERAIGVVYAPWTERQSHYFYADLVRQFDGVIHCDTTTALEPLEKTATWIEGEVPSAYPTGL
jgi:erythromycin esterase-like protein